MAPVSRVNRAPDFYSKSAQHYSLGLLPIYTSLFLCLQLSLTTLSTLPLKILLGHLEAYPEPTRLTRCHFWAFTLPWVPLPGSYPSLCVPLFCLDSSAKVPHPIHEPSTCALPFTLSLLPMPPILLWPFCLWALIPPWPLCLCLLIPALYILSCHCLVTGLCRLWSESCIRFWAQDYLGHPCVLSIT